MSTLFYYDLRVMQLFVAGTTDIIMGSLDATCSLTNNEISWRGEYNGSDAEGPGADRICCGRVVVKE